MNKFKSLTIISIVLSMGLIACGNKPAKESSVSPTSEIPSSVASPSSEQSFSELSSRSILESASEALSSIINSSSSTSSSSHEEPPSSPLEEFKNNVRNNFNKFHLEGTTTMSEFEEYNFSNSDLAYKMGYVVNMTSVVDVDGVNVHTYDEYAGGFGVIELSELAAKLDMPRALLIENLKNLMPIEYVNDELDAGVMYDIYQSRDETIWYSEADKQFIRYDDCYEDTYHYTELMYVLESEREDLVENIKSVILTIAEIGTYNSLTNEITLNDEQVALLKDVFNSQEVSGVKLSIENYYPKQLTLTIDGATANFYISEINNVEVVVPNFIPNAPCIHDYNNHYYDELPNGKHQLYCASCNKYLAEPEDHNLVNNNDHVFCTKCQRILDLKYAPESICSIGEEGISYGAIYQSQTNNKLYFEGFYSTGDSHYLRYTNTFAAYYYSNSKTLVVFKAYPLNDKLLAQPNNYVTLGFACFKILQGVIEIFENITVTDYSFILGSLNDLEYQQVRVNNEPARYYDCYRIFREHNNGAEVSTAVNTCVTLKTTTCQVCQAEVSRYAISNHSYDDTIIKRLNDCYSCYYAICSKCGFELQEDAIEDHINATYTLITDDAYLKLKYGFTSLKGAYIEVNCPTCKREFLIENEGNIECLHAKVDSECNIYEIVNNKVVCFGDGFVLFPHILDEQHICEVCGYIVVEFDGLSFFFDYYNDSDDNLAGILLDSYYAEMETWEVYDEDTPSNYWEMKIYSDEAKTTLVASLEGDCDNTYVIVKNSSGEVMYEVHAGVPSVFH